MLYQLRERVAKASLAICTSGAACATSSIGIGSVAAQSFIPSTLDGWMSVVASSLAILYSLHLLWDWWKPVFKRWGWLNE